MNSNKKVFFFSALFLAVKVGRVAARLFRSETFSSLKLLSLFYFLFSIFSTNSGRSVKNGKRMSASRKDTERERRGESLPPPPQKRSRGETQTQTQTEKILTYEIVRADVSVQLLTTHTFFDLVKVVCKESVVGSNEGVYDHLWDVQDQEGKKYSGPWGDKFGFDEEEGNNACKTTLGSSIGGQMAGESLVLKYDYGCTSTINLILKSIEDLPAGTDKSTFPRRAPLPGQASFTPFVPGEGAANLDELYPALSKLLFKDRPTIGLNLFQPGRKRVQAFISKESHGTDHMMFVREKYSSIEEMLFALNESAENDCPVPYRTSWYGVTVFPLQCKTSPTFKKFEKASSPALDITVARGYDDDVDKAKYEKKFLTTFPKCAAAAGFNQNGKPSKSGERGYIVYKNRTLSVCRGESQVIRSKAPSPGVFDGQDKHVPLSGGVVGKVTIEIKSLQELFCAAEALW